MLLLILRVVHKHLESQPCRRNILNYSKVSTRYQVNFAEIWQYIPYTTASNLVVPDQGGTWKFGKDSGEGWGRRSVSVPFLNSSPIKRCHQKTIPVHQPTTKRVTRANSSTAMLSSTLRVSIWNFNPVFLSQARARSFGTGISYIIRFSDRWIGRLSRTETTKNRG